MGGEVLSASHRVGGSVTKSGTGGLGGRRPVSACCKASRQEAEANSFLKTESPPMSRSLEWPRKGRICADTVGLG